MPRIQPKISAEDIDRLTRAGISLTSAAQQLKISRRAVYRAIERARNHEPDYAKFADITVNLWRALQCWRACPDVEFEAAVNLAMVELHAFCYPDKSTRKEVAL